MPGAFAFWISSLELDSTFVYYPASVKVLGNLHFLPLALACRVWEKQRSNKGYFFSESTDFTLGTGYLAVETAKCTTQQIWNMLQTLWNQRVWILARALVLLGVLLRYIRVPHKSSWRRQSSAGSQKKKPDSVELLIRNSTVWTVWGALISLPLRFSL